MLALTRKVDEGIVINGDIEIKILDIQDGKVKLGITAPKEVSIHRQEIYVSIQQSNQASLTQEMSLDLKLLDEMMRQKK